MEYIIKGLSEENKAKLNEVELEKKREIVMCAILAAAAEYCRKAGDKYIRTSIKEYVEKNENTYSMDLLFENGTAENILNDLIVKYTIDKSSSSLDGKAYCDFFEDWLQFDNRHLKLIAPHYLTLIISNGMFRSKTFNDVIKNRLLLQNTIACADIDDEDDPEQADQKATERESLLKNRARYNRGVFEKHFKYKKKTYRTTINEKTDPRTKKNRYGMDRAEISANFLLLFSELLRTIPLCSPILSLLLFEKETKLPQLILGEHVNEMGYTGIPFSYFIENCNDYQLIEEIKKSILKDKQKCEEILDLIDTDEFSELSQGILNILSPLKLFEKGKEIRQINYRAILTRSYKQREFDKNMINYPVEDSELNIHPEKYFFSHYVLNEEEYEKGDVKSLYDAYIFPNADKKFNPYDDPTTELCKPIHYK